MFESPAVLPLERGMIMSTLVPAPRNLLSLSGLLRSLRRTSFWPCPLQGAPAERQPASLPSERPGSGPPQCAAGLSKRQAAPRGGRRAPASHIRSVPLTRVWAFSSCSKELWGSPKVDSVLGSSVSRRAPRFRWFGIIPPFDVIPFAIIPFSVVSHRRSPTTPYFY